MKPAREPASSRSEPCEPLKNAPRVLPVRGSLLALGERKQTVVRDQLSSQKPPGSRLDSRAQGFSTPVDRRRSSCPPPSPNLVLTRPIERATLRLLGVLRHPTRLFSATVPPASRVPPDGKSLSWMCLTRERWCCTRGLVSRLDMNTCQTSIKTDILL